jgi:hypothetical protein
MYFRKAVLDHRPISMIEKIGTPARYVANSAPDHMEHVPISEQKMPSFVLPMATTSSWMRSAIISEVMLMSLFLWKARDTDESVMVLLFLRLLTTSFWRGIKWGLKCSIAWPCLISYHFVAFWRLLICNQPRLIQLISEELYCRFGWKQYSDGRAVWFVFVWLWVLLNICKIAWPRSGWQLQVPPLLLWDLWIWKRGLGGGYKHAAFCYFSFGLSFLYALSCHRRSSPKLFLMSFWGSSCLFSWKVAATRLRVSATVLSARGESSHLGNLPWWIATAKSAHDFDFVLSGKSVKE